MKNFVKNYNDNYYIFKLAPTHATHIGYMQAGFNHIYCDSGIYKLYTYDGYIPLDNKDASKLFNTYLTDDVLSIDEHGIVCEQYLSTSDDNAIITTLQCNSNCIMCPYSEQSRKTEQTYNMNKLAEIIRYIPQTAPFLTVTGGEPTLLKEDLFVLLNMLKCKFNKTSFLLLTNGRTFADLDFTHMFIECMPNNIRLGIPIYGHNEETHDSITQTSGSFKQSVVGICNLLHYNVEIEIRIVLMQQNINYMREIASYITNNFKEVACVNFMGLELMGNAAKNRADVWLPYDEAFKKCKDAIKLLIANGIDTKLYNIPMCCIEPEYRKIAAMSISDYKISYGAECQKCKLKEICGGVFSSTKRLTNFKGRPIMR